MVRITKVSLACANILFNKESYKFVLTIYNTTGRDLCIYVFIYFKQKGFEKIKAVIFYASNTEITSHV